MDKQNEIHINIKFIDNTEWSAVLYMRDTKSEYKMKQLKKEVKFNKLKFIRNVVCIVWWPLSVFGFSVQYYTVEIHQNLLTESSDVANIGLGDSSVVGNLLSLCDALDSIYSTAQYTHMRACMHMWERADSKLSIL
jgi:hypothetical protein